VIQAESTVFVGELGAQRRLRFASSGEPAPQRLRLELEDEKRRRSLEQQRRQLSAGILAAIASNPPSFWSASNCAAVSRHDAGAPGGDHAAAINPACSATSVLGSVLLSTAAVDVMERIKMLSNLEQPRLRLI